MFSFFNWLFRANSETSEKTNNASIEFPEFIKYSSGLDEASNDPNHQKIANLIQKIFSVPLSRAIDERQNQSLVSGLFQTDYANFAHSSTFQPFQIIPQVNKTSDTPSSVFSHDAKCTFGIISSLSYLWRHENTILRLWSYSNNSKIEIPKFSESVHAVEAIHVHSGVFYDPDITTLITISSKSHIIVYGANFVGGVLKILEKYYNSIGTKEFTVSSIHSLPNGLILLCDSNSEIFYELKYSLGSKEEKLKISLHSHRPRSSVGQIIQPLLKNLFYFPDMSERDLSHKISQVPLETHQQHVAPIFYDKIRRIVYHLAKSSVISAYKSESQLTYLFSIHLSDIHSYLNNCMKCQFDNFGDIVGMASVFFPNAPSICLVAVLRCGIRAYFCSRTTDTHPYVSGLDIRHIRLPPMDFFRVQDSVGNHSQFPSSSFHLSHEHSSPISEIFLKLIQECPLEVTAFISRDNITLMGVKIYDAGISNHHLWCFANNIWSPCENASEIKFQFPYHSSYFAISHFGETDVTDELSVLYPISSTNNDFQFCTLFSTVDPFLQTKNFAIFSGNRLEFIRYNSSNIWIQNILSNSFIDSSSSYLEELEKLINQYGTLQFALYILYILINFSENDQNTNSSMCDLLKRITNSRYVDLKTFKVVHSKNISQVATNQSFSKVYANFGEVAAGYGVNILPDRSSSPLNFLQSHPYSPSTPSAIHSSDDYCDFLTFMLAYFSSFALYFMWNLNLGCIQSESTGICTFPTSIYVSNFITEKMFRRAEMRIGSVLKLLNFLREHFVNCGYRGEITQFSHSTKHSQMNIQDSSFRFQKHDSLNTSSHQMMEVDGETSDQSILPPTRDVSDYGLFQKFPPASSGYFQEEGSSSTETFFASLSNFLSTCKETIFLWRHLWSFEVESILGMIPADVISAQLLPSSHFANASSPSIEDISFHHFVYPNYMLSKNFVIAMLSHVIKIGLPIEAISHRLTAECPSFFSSDNLLTARANQLLHILTTLKFGIHQQSVSDQDREAWIDEISESYQKVAPHFDIVWVVKSLFLLEIYDLPLKLILCCFFRSIAIRDQNLKNQSSTELLKSLDVSQRTSGELKKPFSLFNDSGVVLLQSFQNQSTSVQPTVSSVKFPANAFSFASLLIRFLNELMHHSKSFPDSHRNSHVINTSFIDKIIEILISYDVKMKQKAEILPMKQFINFCLFEWILMFCNCDVLLTLLDKKWFDVTQLTDLKLFLERSGFESSQSADSVQILVDSAIHCVFSQRTYRIFGDTRSQNSLSENLSLKASSFERLEVLWKFYERTGDFLSAAHVLVYLACSHNAIDVPVGFRNPSEFTLSHRKERLSKALVFFQTSVKFPSSNSSAYQAESDNIKDLLAKTQHLLDLTKIQDNLVKELIDYKFILHRQFDSNSNELVVKLKKSDAPNAILAHFNQSLKQISIGPLLDLREMCELYVIPFGLASSKLRILHFCGSTPELTIETVGASWKMYFEISLQFCKVSSNVSSTHESQVMLCRRISQFICELIDEYYLSRTPNNNKNLFPCNTILYHLESLAYKNQFHPLFASYTLFSCCPEFNLCQDYQMEISSAINVPEVVSSYCRLLSEMRNDGSSVATNEDSDISLSHIMESCTYLMKYLLKLTSPKTDAPSDFDISIQPFNFLHSDRVFKDLNLKNSILAFIMMLKKEYLSVMSQESLLLTENNQTILEKANDILSDAVSISSSINC